MLNKRFGIVALLVMVVMTALSLTACSSKGEGAGNGGEQIANSVISVHNIQNGKVNFERKKYKIGDTVAVTIKPDFGYKLKETHLRLMVRL